MVQGYPQSTLLAVAASRAKDKGGPTLSSVPTLRYLLYMPFRDTIRSACGSNGSHVSRVHVYPSHNETLPLSPRVFFLYPFAGVLFLRRLCTSAPNSRVKDYRSANARLRYSTSRKTFNALSANDNKPAAFGEIDSVANESRLFTNYLDDGSMEKNWYGKDRF